MAFSVEEWHSKFNNGEVVHSFEGNITSEAITQILEKVEAKFDEFNESPKISKKVYNILVEVIQNVYHHLDPIKLNGNLNLDERFAMFSLRKDKFGYIISTGNFINNSKIQFIKDRVEQLNSMTVDQIKELYKIVLNNEEYSLKGGGGLGMIDVVKRTQSKIECFFEPVNEEFSFYYFSINAQI
jgi:hypothetical protein